MGGPWTLACMLCAAWSTLAVAGPQAPATAVISAISSLAAHQQVATANSAPGIPQAAAPNIDPGAAPAANPSAPVFQPTGELGRFGVQIVSPTPSEEVIGRVNVRAEVVADEPSAVSAVDFFIDGRLLFSDAQAPYELLWNSGRPADHRIEVRAYGPGRQMVSDVLHTGTFDTGALATRGFSARVEWVELHLRVEADDRESAEVPDDAFEVLENGIPQPVVAVERVAELPLAVGLAIDHSGSMLEQLDNALEAADTFVEGLLTHPNDKAFVLGFADVPMVFQEFTNDTARLADAISLIEGGRYTALYDSVVAASRKFVGVDGRRAIVVLTDGADSGSEHDLRAAIAAAQRADVALYPVAVELSPRFVRERWVLNEMAEQTGGRLFWLGRRGDPAEIYRTIADDLRSQYRVSYVPLVPGGSGEWRGLEVRLKGARSAGLKVRARPGYFAQ